MKSDDQLPLIRTPGFNWGIWVLLLWILGLAIFLRLYDLSDLPLDFHPTRQLHSAVVARGMYYQSLPEDHTGRRDLAIGQWRAEGIIEPPILEWIASRAYLAFGAEQLWFPRFLSGLFWLVGAIPLFLLTRQALGSQASLVALAYFLLLPFAVFASRSFQPDPLMTALILWAFWAINRWHEKPTLSAALLAGLLGGLAVLVKAVAVFFVAGAWLGILLVGAGLKRALRDRTLWAAALLTLLPYAFYHIYGVYIAGFLGEQYSLRFFPGLWLDPLFYLRWARKLDASLGLAWVLLAVPALLGLPSKTARGLWLGALVGYFAYSLAFSYHTGTHDYYQLPLVPIVSIGLGAAASFILAALRPAKWVAVLAVSTAFLGGVILTSYDIRSDLKNTDYRSEAVAMAALGAELRDFSIVGLFPDYGYRLVYWGWVTPTNWFAAGDFEYRALAGQDIDPLDLFAEKTKGKDLFVVSDLDALAAQPVLQQILSANYPVWKQDSGLIIYDLR